LYILLLFVAILNCFIVISNKLTQFRIICSQLKNLGEKDPKPIQETEITPVTTSTSSSSSSELEFSGKTSSSSVKQPMKQLFTNLKEGGVTKEVLLILQEMNAKLNAQASRLQKQEQRLQSLTDQMDEQEYCDYNDDYECQEQYDDACMSEQPSITFVKPLAPHI